MPGMTNRGKKCIMNAYFRADSDDEPVGFKLVLCTSANTPDADTNVLADLTEIAAGNGYAAGGLTIERSAVGFDVINEDDANDRGDIQLKDGAWTASGGTIPSSGNGARWAVLVDDAATPNIIVYFDLTSDRTVSDGQTLTLQNSEIRFQES